MSDIAQKAGLSEKEFARLNERMLQTQAAKNAERALNDIARAANLTQKETSELAQKMGVSTQTMASQSAGLADTLKKHWIAATAAIAGAFILINKAAQYMDLGAKAQQAEESFRLVADSAGESADRILAAMNKAAKGTVDDSDIMQKAVQGMMLGFSGDQLVKIMETARVSARVAGEDVKTAYENITEAIGTNMPRALKKYGLITKEEMELVNKALNAGVENIGLYEIAMAHAALQAAKMGEVQDNAAEQLQRTKAQWNDLKETIGGALITAMQKVMGGFQWIAAGALGAAGALTSFLSSVVSVSAWISEKTAFTEKAKTYAAGLRTFADDLKRTAADLGGAAEELAGKAAANIAGIAEAATKGSQVEIDAAKKSLEQLKKNLQARIDEKEASKKAAQEKESAEKQILEVIRKASLEIEGIGKTEYEKEIARIDSEVQKWREAGADKVMIEKATVAQVTALRDKLFAKNIEEYFKSEEKAILENYEAWKKNREEEARIESERLQMFEKNATALMASEEKAILDNYENWKKGREALAQQDTKYAEERWKIERKLNEDVAKFSGEEFEFRRKSLEEQYKIYVAFGIKETTLRKWHSIELQKIWEEEALKYGTFWDGISVAYTRNLRDQETWAKQGYKIWNDVFGRNGALERSLEDFFNDAFKGQLKSAEDYFKSFANAILAAFSRMLAQMVAQYIASGIASFFGISMPGGGGIGGIGGNIGNSLIGTGAKAAYNYFAPAGASAGTAAGTTAAAGGGGSAAGGTYAVAGGGGAAVAAPWLTTTGAGMGAGAGIGAGAISYAGAGIPVGYTITAGGAIVATPGAATVGMGAGATGATAAGGGGATVGGGTASGATAAGAGGAATGIATFALPAAIIAYGLMDKGTQQYLNPFNKNTLTQSDLAGYIINPSARLDISRPELAATLALVKNDPFFNPDNLWKYYITKTGMTPTNDSIYYQGREFQYFMNDPYVRSIAEKAAELTSQHIRISSGGEGSALGIEYFGKGGIISEPIFGLGKSGMKYLFGESGPEKVMPLATTKNQSGQMAHFSIELNGRVLTEFIYDETKRGIKVVHSRGIVN